MGDGRLLNYFGPMLGWQWYPVSQAHFVLGLTQALAIRKDEALRKIALKVSTSLLAAGVATASDSIGFPIKFAPLGYRLSPLWYSSLAQSYCASAFRRIGLIENDNAWIENARRVMKFVVDRPELCTKNPNGGYWYQEYPTEPSTPVLGGHMIALIGFLDIGTSLRDSDCLPHFEQGLRALSTNLGKFDEGGLSVYDSRRRIIAKPSYQRLHVVLLRFLADVTHERTLTEFADRWESGFLEKWGWRAWLSYAQGTLQSGLQVEGVKFPLSYMSYALGDQGLSIAQRLPK
jgi:hypothetical protein